MLLACSVVTVSSSPANAAPDSRTADVAAAGSAAPDVPTADATPGSPAPDATPVGSAIPEGSAAPDSAADLTGRPVAETDRSSGVKLTARLAQSDPQLLTATSTEVATVLVKLDYDAVAAYTGGVDGFAPTSPSVTGRALTAGGGDIAAYTGHVAGVEQTFVDRLAVALPEARVGTRLRTVYGGVALSLPADRAADVLALPGVLAVQADTRHELLTDSSGDFVGAPTIYSALGSSDTAGAGTIVGVLDSGLWPEHPSFADPGLSEPPAKADGTPRTCDFGDNPLTPGPDPFACTNKLISGESFLATYNATVGGETYPGTARDSEGHGTHTASTAAGSPVAGTSIFGIDRGPVSGIAPGAQVAAYKVCGAKGCFASDSVAAVQQAILDGVDVINYSISGGTSPYTDPVELAFLDAYQAGVFVAASAGNEGPAAGTVNHLSPWVTTVAASTQRREFRSALTVTAGEESFTADGASITAGVGPAPVVLASAAPYNDVRCEKPAPAGTLAGMMVACERGGNGRVAKGWNVLQGGAAGMVLYNPAPADTETDNHWLPTVQLADGAAFLAFMKAHSAVSGTFSTGAAADGAGDVMAGFSSRGPAGGWLKPDLTAPGVQVLAGQTPTPDGTDTGPPAQYFQAIAGTSMSAPHVAGAGALLVALHPSWSPGQIRSALMTTATTAVVKPDGVTPADPFDLGAGRIDLTRAGDPGLTFDVPTADFVAAGEPGPRGGLDLNLPSIDVPLLTGEITTTRTATNTTDTPLRYRARATAPDGARITVTPSLFTVDPGSSVPLTIVINGAALAAGQYFAQISLTDLRGTRDLHLPVAFDRQQGDIALSTTCTPSTITLLPRSTSTCTVTATNGGGPTTVSLTSTLSSRLRLTSLAGPDVNRTDRGPLQGRTRLVFTDLALPGKPGVPSIAPGALRGYRSLAPLGIPATPMGDEEIVNYDVPAFVYGGGSYTRIGVTSDGYLVVGGGNGRDDVTFLPQQVPNAKAPNNVLAPFWTDLDGTGAPGIFVGTVSDGTDSHLVVEWQVREFDTQNLETFQVWIGLNGTEDITFAYDPANMPSAPPALSGLTVGAENADGTSGDQIDGVPTGDLRVSTSTGGSVSYTFTVQGQQPGPAAVRTTLTSPALPGSTIAAGQLSIVKR